VNISQPKLRSEKFDNDDDDNDDDDDDNNNNNNNNNNNKTSTLSDAFRPLIVTEICSRETGQVTIFYILKFALLDNRRARKYSKPNYGIL